MVEWNGKEYLTVAETMKRKGVVARQTVYSAIRRGQLEQFSPPGTNLVLLAPEAVDAWVVQEGPGRPVGSRSDANSVKDQALA